MFIGDPSQLGQGQAKPFDFGEFQFLLFRSKYRMIAVLNTAGGIDADSLYLAAAKWIDPDMRPGGRNDQRTDPLERFFVSDRATVPVAIAEPARAPAVSGYPVRTPSLLDRRSRLRNVELTFPFEHNSSPILTLHL